MGQIDKPNTEHELSVHCNQCGIDYWIDSTQTNECPKCGHIDFDVNEGDN